MLRLYQPVMTPDGIGILQGYIVDGGVEKFRVSFGPKDFERLGITDEKKIWHLMYYPKDVIYALNKTPFTPAETLTKSTKKRRKKK